MTALAEEHHLPVENLLTPDYLRRMLWTPPATRDRATLAEAVADQLAGTAPAAGRSTWSRRWSSRRSSTRTADPEALSRAARRRSPGVCGCVLRVEHRAATPRRSAG